MAQSPQGAAPVQRGHDVVAGAVDDLFQFQLAALAVQPELVAVLQGGDKAQEFAGLRVLDAGVDHRAAGFQCQLPVLGGQPGVGDAQIVGLLPHAVAVHIVTHRQAEGGCYAQGRDGELLHAVPVGVRAVELKREGGPPAGHADVRGALHLSVAPVGPGHGQPAGDVGREHIPQLSLAVVLIAQDAPGDRAGHAGYAPALHGGTYLLVTLAGLQIHGQVTQRGDAPQHARRVTKGKGQAVAGLEDRVKHPAAPPFPVRTVPRASGRQPSALCCKCTG